MQPTAPVGPATKAGYAATVVGLIATALAALFPDLPAQETTEVAGAVFTVLAFAITQVGRYVQGNTLAKKAPATGFVELGRNESSIGYGVAGGKVGHAWGASDPEARAMADRARIKADDARSRLNRVERALGFEDQDGPEYDEDDGRVYRDGEAQDVGPAKIARAYSEKSEDRGESAEDWGDDEPRTDAGDDTVDHGPRGDGWPPDEDPEREGRVHPGPIEADGDEALEPHYPGRAGAGADREDQLAARLANEQHGDACAPADADVQEAAR